MEKELRLGKLWDEWLTAESSSRTQADFEICGLLTGMRHAGNIFHTNRLRTARRLMRLWPSTSYYEKFNFTPAISLITQKNHKPRVKITLPEKILKFPKNLRGSWAWLKGLWGSAGGLYFPKTGYYLTLIISGEKNFELTSKAVELTGLSWNVRKNEFTLRNHDDIMTFLCNAGMTGTALKFDETVMMRLIKNHANVIRNYEAANIARSVKAAREQLVMAEKFLSLKNVRDLPKNLKEIAELRINNPHDTLEELGEKLNPPVKKSTVKYYLNKIKNFMEIEKNEELGVRS